MDKSFGIKKHLTISTLVELFLVIFLIVSAYLSAKFIYTHYREQFLKEGAVLKSELIKKEVRRCNLLAGNLIVFDALDQGLAFECIQIKTRVEGI